MKTQQSLHEFAQAEIAVNALSGRRSTGEVKVVNVGEKREDDASDLVDKLRSNPALIKQILGEAGLKLCGEQNPVETPAER